MAVNAADLVAINRLLAQALELPPHERGAWLDALPAEHAPLAPTLRELLARADAPETADFLRTLPKIDRESAPLADRAAGDVVGPYRLLRPLGRGGMGTVWLAERADGTIKRQIALKLPLVAGAPALRDRLARERDLLAALEHPNIARLYDAGVDAGGQPYLALEYVEGEPIDAYCRSRALDVRARLGVFVQAARAVAHAHARLTLHRDLKPANILVTADGQVRLLDFGIAKLLEDGGARETELTQLAGRALTPDYASPEQILGQPLTVASDVYALGVVLYELLASQRPYRLKRDSRGALEDAIVGVEPQPPSALATDRALRRRLAGDLDTIALKALKKAPGERYASVLALVDDLERHLTGAPVHARPDSFGYRARKFVARHRLATAAGSAVFATLVAAVAIVVQQRAEAVRQRDRALAEAKRAQASQELASFLLGDAESRGGRGGMRERLQQSRELLRKQFADEPRIRAALLGQIAGRFAELGDAQAEADVTREIEAIAAQLDDGSLNAYVACVKADALRLEGRIDEAKALVATGLQQYARDADPDPSARIECLLTDSYVASDERDHARAIERTSEVVALLEAAGNTRSQRYTSALGALTVAYANAGDLVKALQFNEREMEVERKLGRDETLGALITLGRQVRYLNRVGRPADALQASESILKSAPAARDSGIGAAVHFDRGESFLMLGQPDRARVEFELAERLPTAQWNRITSLLGSIFAARTQVRLGELQAAEQQLARIAPDIDRLVASDDPAGALGLMARAELASARKRPDEAQQWIDAALARVPARPGSTPNVRPPLLDVAAQLALARGDAQQALAFADEYVAIERRRTADGAANALLGEALLLRARAAELAGDRPASRRDARDALAHLERTLPAGRAALALSRRLSYETAASR